MIGIVLALQLATPQAVTGLTYENVPPEIVRVSVHGWQEQAPPVAVPSDVLRQGTDVIVRAASGRRSVVRLERADGAYLLDGPFWWPAVDAGRVVEKRWRRTIVTGAADPIAGESPLEWLPGSAERTGEWPQCFQSSDRLWVCWGVGVDEPGVLVRRDLARVWWTVVSRGSVSNLRSTRWGRLIVAPDAMADPSELRVRFAHPVPPSSQRVRGVRVDTAVVAGAQSTAVAPGVVWLSGDDVPAGAWVDVRAARLGPAYLVLEEVAAGSPSVPLAVPLEETRSLDGVAAGIQDQPAGGALVTLFRLIDPISSGRESSREKPRRVLVAETIADAAGAFHFDGVSEADYEIVAWHPQFGRGSAGPPRVPGLFTIRLQSPGTVRGRVLAGGKPIAGVDVISLPGPDAFRSTDDFLELKGGDARTGVDGRFAVMLAAGGGGELRVGGGTWPIRRVPLPRVPAPLVDLGDIDLGSPLAITIVLDQESACDVRATGPIGHSGLQIVMAARTGPGLFRIVLPEPGLWAFGLLCGHEARPLSPVTVQISAAQAGKEVRFSVR